MLNLYEELPWLSGKEFVITGESFAGKYLSYISKAILDYNELASTTSPILVKNLILSNPLVAVPTERMN